MKIKHNQDHPRIKRAPLWKWLVIILLVIGMPLFFSFIKSSQMQQALNSLPPEPENAGAAKSTGTAKIIEKN